MRTPASPITPCQDPSRPQTHIQQPVHSYSPHKKAVLPARPCRSIHSYRYLPFLFTDTPQPLLFTAVTPNQITVIDLRDHRSDPLVVFKYSRKRRSCLHFHNSISSVPRSVHQNLPALAASSTLTATATVAPTIGLLPIPMRPIIST